MQKDKFKLLFFISATLLFFVVALRSYYVPFNHDEAATFFMYIQSGKYMPFYSQVDANNHVLNSFLGNFCFHLFGSSPFALRLPNLVGFIILIFGTYKLSQQLNYTATKVFLFVTFLVSFHWLSFFSACRGYGLSMGLLILGIAYFLNYITTIEFPRNFYIALICFQLAVSSNLILMIPVALLSGIIFIIQISNKQLVKPFILGAWLLHAVALMYWISFSFYLQDNGALYYGDGDSYWKVTFVSLIQLLVGFSSPFIKWVLVSLFTVSVVLTLYVNKNNLFKVKEHISKPSKSLLLLVVLAVLSIAFYTMHKLIGVNYPEDRTGLFFYVFFVLVLSFTWDELPLIVNTTFFSIASGIIVIHFCMTINFRKHSLNVYETIPQHFYDTLINEQKKSSERITIGGHRVRELFFGFMNYRNGGYLNPADPIETMQMNCDYYIATRAEEKYYKPYYNVIDTEPDWGFVVLKRKLPLQKNKVAEFNSIHISSNSDEYINIYHHADTTFANTNPLLVEVNFDIEKIATPANVWLVLQVNDSLDNMQYFKRYPLQWTGYNNNGKKQLSYSLITGNLPKTSKKVVCFFWNINKEPLAIHVNSLKLFQVNGDGVNYVAPDVK